MKKLFIKVNLFIVALSVAGLSSAAQAAVIDDVLNHLQQQGAVLGQVEQGAAMWRKTYSAADKPQQRSCESCHSRDLKQVGKHVKTGKPIDAMAPSANPERFNDAKKIAKWFKRNCKWTIGRECNAQEQADVLSYLRGL